ILGLLAGTGLALLRELMDSSYHEPRTVQESLRLPVLAAIPTILLDADRRARRRRQRREMLAAAAVTATVLIVSAAGYAYVNLPGLWSGAESTETTPAQPVNPVPDASPAPADDAASQAPAIPSGR